VRGGSIISEARRRAGLTQADLGARLGTTQSAIARWETGKAEPSFTAVIRAVRACGLELDVRLLPGDDSDAGLIEQLLALSPRQRVDHHQRLLDTARRLQAARPVDA
jgi:transcriptional regulator with XRE-family HTH domain